MKSAFMLLAVVLCSPRILGQSESEIRDRIVGTWKLVSAEQTLTRRHHSPIPNVRS
jgi:hypothetical protein